MPSELREFVHDIDPDLQQTSNDQAPVKDLQLRNTVKLNIHYSSMSENDIRYMSENHELLK